ncbi:isopentenyl-diphosphate Delta-isomerase [Ferruginibacter lapsinanis]|uniref:isopentenyl-diphosphate Delta-isomerase n=1 Tax=Ferruginibacter lapsinanis TaxID=563172 RepID=UPI001E5AE3A1|nr:isopentenyl-diphosphate Delta-isomerase [Ferruginibacter lapsinanis]UEG50543.1 isopentenyl-diphosphate Delta-isomerase [Ferruginibacter lapsinanis]
MNVILVDKNDVQIGVMEKMEAHQKALLHRAFSIFIFNDKEEMLLHKRSDKKYHSPGLWTNACCSHPQPNEETLESALNRLQMEMGFVTGLTEIFSFTYKADFDNGLTEHEFDHVFVGHYNGDILPNTDEVSDYCFMSMEKISASIQSHPHKYTEWFKIAFPKVEDYLALNSVGS